MDSSKREYLLKIFFYLYEVSKLIKLTHCYRNQKGFYSRELLTERGNQRFSWLLKLLHILFLVVVTWDCTYLQSYQSLHLILMYFTKCKFYLSNFFKNIFY